MLNITLPLKVEELVEIFALSDKEDIVVNLFDSLERIDEKTMIRYLATSGLSTRFKIQFDKVTPRLVDAYISSDVNFYCVQLIEGCLSELEHNPDSTHSVRLSSFLLGLINFGIYSIPSMSEGKLLLKDCPVFVKDESNINIGKSIVNNLKYFIPWALDNTDKLHDKIYTRVMNNKMVYDGNNIYYMMYSSGWTDMVIAMFKEYIDIKETA